jgi:hypothetical protein
MVKKMDKSPISVISSDLNDELAQKFSDNFMKIQKYGNKILVLNGLHGKSGLKSNKNATQNEEFIIP